MKNYLDIRKKFLLNPEITFLNHGSFGACPKPIFEDYRKWQIELEKEPIQFITKKGINQLDFSKQELAKYINCEKQDIVYVTNPTLAMNTVIKSLKLEKDDEILTTNQEYGAIEKTWEYYCNKVGAKLIKADIKLPITSKENFLKQFWKSLSKNTKIVFLSHITSPTALIFPVKEIAQKAKQLGLLVVIDGAHAPGHIPLNLKEIKPDAYTGACHKWMLAPKGSSFLYVEKSLQKQIDPLIISWGYKSEFPSDSIFQDYHQYNGTRDFSAFLTTPKALDFFKENNWEKQKERCRNELKYYYPIVAKEFNSSPICPVTDEFLAQICSIPISTKNPVALKELLYSKYKIEIPIVVTKKQIYLRISFQAYNSNKEIEYLIDSIREIKKETNFIQTT